MKPRRAITPPDSRASLAAVKPLRFAPTPFGAGGLDDPSGPPRIGNYVMAGSVLMAQGGILSVDLEFERR